MFMQKIMTNSLLLLSLVALTACPDNSQNRNNQVTPQAQTPPPGNNIGSNPANGPDQLDTIMKSFMCEFEGLRNKDGKYFDSYVSIPKTYSVISLDSRIESVVNLRSKFLGFDIGKFGEISMRFVPASKANSGTDTIVLINKGLNKNMTMSQSGFAGQMVKLEARGGGMFVTVSCKGISQFRSGLAQTTQAAQETQADKMAQTGKTKLVCSGVSSSAVTNEEKVDVTIPLNSIQAGDDIEISKELSAKLDSAATSITFTGSIDPEYAPEVISTASLKSPAKFCTSIEDKYSKAVIKVTCSLQ